MQLPLFFRCAVAYSAQTILITPLQQECCAWYEASISTKRLDYVYTEEKIRVCFRYRYHPFPVYRLYEKTRNPFGGLTCCCCCKSASPRIVAHSCRS